MQLTYNNRPTKLEDGDTLISKHIGTLGLSTITLWRKDSPLLDRSMPTSSLTPESARLTIALIAACCGLTEKETTEAGAQEKTFVFERPPEQP